VQQLGGIEIGEVLQEGLSDGNSVIFGTEYIGEGDRTIFKMPSLSSYLEKTIRAALNTF
jgi:hypothetical protein